MSLSATKALDEDVSSLRPADDHPKHPRKHKTSRVRASVFSEICLVKTAVPIQIKEETEQTTKLKKQRRSLVDRQTDYIKNSAAAALSLALQMKVPKKSFSQRLEEVLDQVKPPKKWVTKNGQQWIERLSKEPAKKLDVMKLEEKLDSALRRRNTSDEGLSNIRSEIYSQCFDEVIRQVCIRNIEQALLLLNIRNEARLMVNSLSKTYSSRMAFALRKSLLMKHKVAYITKELAKTEEDCKIKEELLKELRHKLKVVQEELAEPDKLDSKVTAECESIQQANAIMKIQIAGLLSPKKDGKATTVLTPAADKPAAAAGKKDSKGNKKSINQDLKPKKSNIKKT